MLEIRNTTKQRPLSPEADFAAIKNTILGKTYTLSLVFVGEKKARDLNKHHRNKSYTPNILSFPLDNTNGEMFISLQRAHLEAKEFEMTPKQYVLFLFIHVSLHLTGLDHGDKMTKLEQKFAKQFIK
jgi:probable rRNA maturation factor